MAVTRQNDAEHALRKRQLTQLGDDGGVDAAAQERADWNVADLVERDGFGEEIAKLLDGPPQRLLKLVHRAILVRRAGRAVPGADGGQQEGQVDGRVGREPGHAQGRRQGRDRAGVSPRPPLLFRRNCPAKVLLGAPIPE